MISSRSVGVGEYSHISPGVSVKEYMPNSPLAQQHPSIAGKSVRSFSHRFNTTVPLKETHNTLSKSSPVTSTATDSNRAFSESRKNEKRVALAAPIPVPSTVSYAQSILLPSQPNPVGRPRSRMKSPKNASSMPQQFEFVPTPPSPLSISPPQLPLPLNQSGDLPSTSLASQIADPSNVGYSEEFLNMTSSLKSSLLQNAQIVPFGSVFSRLFSFNEIVSRKPLHNTCDYWERELFPLFSENATIRWILRHSKSNHVADHEIPICLIPKMFCMLYDTDVLRMRVSVEHSQEFALREDPRMRVLISTQAAWHVDLQDGTHVVYHGMTKASLNAENRFVFIELFVDYFTEMIHLVDHLNTINAIRGAWLHRIRVSGSHLNTKQDVASLLHSLLGDLVFETEHQSSVDEYGRTKSMNQFLHAIEWLKEYRDQFAPIAPNASQHDISLDYRYNGNMSFSQPTRGVNQRLGHSASLGTLPNTTAHVSQSGALDHSVTARRLSMTSPTDNTSGSNNSPSSSSNSTNGSSGSTNSSSISSSSNTNNNNGNGNSGITHPMATATTFSSNGFTQMQDIFINNNRSSSRRRATKQKQNPPPKHILPKDQMTLPLTNESRINASIDVVRSTDVKCQSPLDVDASFSSDKFATIPLRKQEEQLFHSSEKGNDEVERLLGYHRSTPQHQQQQQQQQQPPKEPQPFNDKRRLSDSQNEDKKRPKNADPREAMILPNEYDQYVSQSDALVIDKITRQLDGNEPWANENHSLFDMMFDGNQLNHYDEKMETSNPNCVI